MGADRECGIGRGRINSGVWGWIEAESNSDLCISDANSALAISEAQVAKTMKRLLTLPAPRASLNPQVELIRLEAELVELSELSHLARWIREKLEKRGLENKYAELVERIRVNTMPGQQRVPFQNERDQLFKELRSIPLYELTVGQLEVLEKLGLSQCIGEEGVRKIEQALGNSGLDIASALQEVERMAQAVSSGIGWAKDMLPRLELLTTHHQTVDPSEEVLLRVRFSSDASIENVTDLKKWTANWFDISRGVSMLHGEKPERIRVVGASSGSIIMMLAAPYVVTKTITIMLSDILKVAEHILRLRRATEEIRSLKIKNDAAQRALEEEIESTRQAAVEDIVNAVMERIESKSKPAGDVKNAVEKSVERLLEFSQKGGEVDFVINEPDADAPEDLLRAQTELRSAVEDVRRIEHSMKQLELDLKPRR